LNFFESDKKMASLQRHPYHLVDPSPWPLFTGFGALGMTTGLVMYLQNYFLGGYVCILGFLSVVGCMGLWWRDVVREATFLGHHTKAVQNGLRMGMILFIASEVMFFFAFFWAFFWASVAPNIELGGIWPPPGIEVLNAWEVPLLNTVILLTSGVSCTWAHHALAHKDRRLEVLEALTITVVLGVIFTACQAIEYMESTFKLSDGVYGSSFFMATGFHGFHVLVGTTFLFVCLLRAKKDHFTTTHQIGFEAAAWYWHFVDVVWLFLFATVYYWGGI
jgi:heme/copper-type cytochrome/quinol oxidase subunit 3